MSQPMSTQEVLQILVPVIDVLDQMGVVYRVGGSVASSYHGQQRATQDVDLIADLHLAQVGAFVAAFDPAKYLVQDQSVTDAILRQRSFNIIELTTMKQSLVTKKNRKVRRLRELYPEVNIKILYERDYRNLIWKYGLGNGDGEDENGTEKNGSEK